MCYLPNDISTMISGITSKTTHNSTYVIVVTSKNTIKHAIMSTKSTDNTLYLSVFKIPVHAVLDQTASKGTNFYQLVSIFAEMAYLCIGISIAHRPWTLLHVLLYF